jgi:hypothetical protein
MSKAVALFIVATSLPAPLLAQVGHDPARSPYQPIRSRTSLLVIGGYLAGSSGILGIGPADAFLGGLRYEMRLTGPTDASLAVSYGNFERLVPDPRAPADSQITGPVNQSVVFVDAGLQILLTGDKTWKGLAPYLGATLGMGFGSGVPQDTSGYRFRAKFTTGPMLGLRVYPASGLTLRLEGRMVFWQLKYPTTFFLSPERAPTDAPLLDQQDDSDSEWTAHPTLSLGLGWSFRL